MRGLGPQDISRGLRDLFTDPSSDYGHLVGVLVNKVWISDGFNGLFNWLGTARETTTYTNPHGTQYTASMSTGTNPEYGTDHSSGTSVVTDNAANSWWKADFGTGGYLVRPSRIGILGRDTGTFEVRNWKLQGSNDNSAWTDLLTVTNAGPGASTWYSQAVTTAEYWRYLRVLQTGLDSSGADYLVLGDVEIWGQLKLA